MRKGFLFVVPLLFAVLFAGSVAASCPFPNGCQDIEQIPSWYDSQEEEESEFVSWQAISAEELVGGSAALVDIEVYLVEQDQEGYTAVLMQLWDHDGDGTIDGSEAYPITGILWSDLGPVETGDEFCQSLANGIHGSCGMHAGGASCGNPRRCSIVRGGESKFVWVFDGGNCVDRGGGNDRSCECNITNIIPCPKYRLTIAESCYKKRTTFGTAKCFFDIQFLMEGTFGAGTGS